jgi:outer membrane protein OmpA-like peptidoglycan-associated protein
MLSSVNGALSSSLQKNPKRDYTLMLSDEILVKLLVDFLPDATTLARVASVNKRFHGLLREDQSRVVKRVLSLDNYASSLGIKTLKELGFYQVVTSAGLFQEYRLGFRFVSTTIDDDNGESSEIKGSTQRIQDVARILQQFTDARVVVESHCGTAAPTLVAADFSRSRGQAVCSELINITFATNYYYIHIEDRVTMRPWGKRVTEQVVALANHKNCTVASKGRGWVEVYVQLRDGLQLPPRPDYYDGLQAFELGGEGYY